MKNIIAPKRILAAALLVVLFVLGSGGRPSAGNNLYNFYGTKGFGLANREEAIDQYMDQLVIDMIDDGMDPPRFISETTGTIFGVPVTAKNYRHMPYFDTDDAVMSIIYGKSGRTIGVAFTLESDRTDAACRSIASYSTELSVVCPYDEPIFERTWTNGLSGTVSVGTYGERTVFFVSDTVQMTGCGAWQSFGETE